MRVGNFSVFIPEGIERDSGHVEMEHGKQYVLRLMNHGSRRCDAEVTVDGKNFGFFRVDAGGSCALERMPDDHGRLTFYSTNTAESVAAGESNIEIPDRGLIRVRFVPERKPVYRPPVQVSRGAPYSGPRPLGMTENYASMGGGGAAGASCFSRPDEGTTQTDFAGEPERETKTSGGITGVSGHSGQQFHIVSSLDRDEAAAVTISLRLVTANLEPRPLLPTWSKGNPVPGPV